MKNISLKRNVLCGVALFVAQAATAAVITWDAPTQLDALDDFNVEGFSVESINVGGSEPSVR